MEVSLKVGGFIVEKGVGMTMIQEYIDIQESDLGRGGVPYEMDKIMNLDKNWLKRGEECDTYLTHVCRFP
jgi:hypothetical protein